MRMGLSRTGVSFQQVPWRFFGVGGGVMWFAQVGSIVLETLLLYASA